MKVSAVGVCALLAASNPRLESELETGAARPRVQQQPLQL